MSHEAWTALVWGLAIAGFLALELPAVFGRAPWSTLSEAVWLIETDWRPATILVLLFCGWLLAHFVARWGA